MACLGGTRDEPKVWWRYNAAGRFVRVEGRICTGNPKRYNNPHTSRRGCAECPAFRGLRWDERVATGLAQDGTVYALSPAEHDRYQDALMTAAMEDEPEALWAFERSMDREARQRSDGTWQVLPGTGHRRALEIGDPDALDREAERMRAWRAAHPGADKRKRKRDRAAYMRQYRASRNPVRTVITTSSIAEESDEPG